MKLGFIGLGKMGTPMAGRLIDQGHEVGLFNRTTSKADPLVERGGTRLGSAAEAAGFGGVVITMLENDAALAEIALGDEGFRDALGQGGVHIAMGTHSLTLVETLNQRHQQHGQQLVAAPVLGRPPAAEAGQLGIVAAGDEGTIAQCQPIWEVLGRRVYRAGSDPQAAAVAKIANNFVLACAIEAMGEGFSLTRKCGVPMETFYEILTDGLFGGAAHKIYGRLIADSGYFKQPGFSATTGLKDINLALAASDALAVPLPSIAACRDRLLGAIANNHGDADWSVMAHVQARSSGIADR